MVRPSQRDRQNQIRRSRNQNLSAVEQARHDARERSRIADHREDMLPEEQEARRVQERARFAERQDNMSWEEQEARRVQERARIADHREDMLPEEQEARRVQERVRISDRREHGGRTLRDLITLKDFEVTADEVLWKLHFFKRHEDYKVEDFFSDMQDSPVKAVMLYYLNSGYLRFDQYKEYDANFDRMRVDIEKLKREIQEEKLTEEELGDIITCFMENHSYTEGELVSCGSCGLRLLERESSPKIKYLRLYLCDPDAKLLKYDMLDLRVLEKLREQQDGIITIPINAACETRNIEPWKALSVYESREHGYFHLHPELVELDEEEKEYVRICPTCWNCLKKKKEKEVPPLSIAACIEFGWSHRLALEMPNLHEQIIMAGGRLSHGTIKVSSNTCGHVNFTRHKLRLNAIIFAQDSPEVVSKLLSGEEMFSVEGLKNTLRLYFVDPSGKFDKLMDYAYGRHDLLARPWVLYQWMLVLQRLNPYYKDITIPSWRKLHRNVTASNNFIKANAVKLNDKDALRFEASLGSDIAQAQSTEIPPTAESEVTQEGDLEEESTTSTAACDGGDFEGTIPMRYSYVTSKPMASLDNTPLQRAACLSSIGRFLQLDSLDDDEDEEDEEDVFEDDDSFSFGSEVESDNERNVTRRGGNPLNDFQNDDFALCACFPHVFLTGRAYQRSAGKLSFEQRNHLLRHFTQVASRDRRLLFYLFDTRKRFQAIFGVNAYVNRNEHSVEAITQLLEDDQERNQLKAAIKRPDTKEAKNLLRKYLPHFRFSGQDIAYGAMQGSKAKSLCYALTRRYQPPSDFLTLSFDDPNNPRALRATYRTIDNKRFPAKFEEGSIHGSNGKEFMEKLREASDVAWQGVIDMSGHSRSERASAAIDDPVAFVIESKSMINDVCSILLGIPPEGFYGHSEGESSRKTRYYEIKKVVIGHCLVYIGVVEDHAKGTLHYHILVYGGLSPYVLQRFASLEELRKVISEMLDSKYKSELPSKTHVSVLVKEILHEQHTKLGLNVPQLGRVTKEPILTRPEPLSILSEDGKLSFNALHEHTNEQGAHQNLHKHMRTCRKGFLGLTGCRMCAPWGKCNHTHPVLLKALNGAAGNESEECNDSADDNDSDDYNGAQEDDEIEIDNSQEEERRRKKKDTEDKFAFRVVDPIPEDQNDRFYSVRNILEQTKKASVIVWETNRPSPNPILLQPEVEPGSGQFSVMTPDLPQHGRWVIPMTRQGMIESLQFALSDSPAYDDNSAFWPWIVQLEQNKLVSFYAELVDKLSKANGYVATYNPVISYCTGSHNNLSLLGSLVQAKGAIFYVCPYMGKNKYPLQQCLTLLENALNHVVKFGNRNNVTDANTDERTTKRVLERVLNKMNLKMELSDYQIVADLLDLPSIICSNKFVYGNPLSDQAYRTFVQMKEDSEVALDALLYELNSAREGVEYHYQRPSGASAGLPFNIQGEEETNQEDHTPRSAAARSAIYDKNDLLQKEIGRLRVFRFTEPDIASPDGIRTFRTLVPTAAMYGNRGKELKDLNRNEYRALVNFRKKVDDSSRRSKDFEYAEALICASQYVQYLVAKQATPILTRRPPRYPGKKPASRTATDYLRWKERADEYAKYFLHEYRPETTCYSAGQENSYAYDWSALENWVQELQHDHCIISKFRLMAMHTNMQGFYTNFQTKVMLSKYRGRNRTLWSQEEKQRFAAQDYLQRREAEHDDNALDEYVFEQKYTSLTSCQNQQMDLQIEHDKAQSIELEEAQKGVHLIYPLQKQPVQSTFLQKRLAPKEVQQMGKHMKSWIPPDSSSTETTASKRRATREFKNQLKTRINARYKTLNRKQKEFYNLYSHYLRNPDSKELRPPDIVLLHGAAGTGKSEVTRGIYELAELLQLETLRTAFNNINAVDMNGQTTASLIRLNAQVHSRELRAMGVDERMRFIESLKLIIIDEISNQAPFYLAQLHHLCQQCLNVFDKPFGGIPVLLLGDLNQLDPVKAGLSLTRALMLICEYLHGNCKDDDEQETGAEGPPPAKRQRTSTPMKRKRTQANQTFGKEKFGEDHPFTVGAKLLAEAKWFELDEQTRAQDSQHVALVNRLYHHERLTLSDLKQYDLLSQHDFEDSESPWLVAPIIVPTNRERFTLTHHSAMRYAKAKGTFVIRWPTKWSHWKQKPKREEHVVEALTDPCFYEYFVKGAEGFLCDTINKKLGLVNQRSIKYHSLTIDDTTDQTNLNVALLHAQPGEIITLQNPPTSVNVELNKDDFNQEQLLGLQNFSVAKVGYNPVVPILEGGLREKENVVVYGGVGYKPSKVTIRLRFPTELAFAITVNKAEGRTLEDVILALSYRDAAKCNFTYSALYVALSRVRNARNIRLLLRGKNECEKWGTLTYVQDLKPDISVPAFFAGYRHNQEQDWKIDTWDSQKAYKKYKELQSS